MTDNLTPIGLTFTELRTSGVEPLKDSRLWPDLEKEFAKMVRRNGFKGARIEAAPDRYTMFMPGDWSVPNRTQLQEWLKAAVTLVNESAFPSPTTLIIKKDGTVVMKARKPRRKLL